MLKVKFLLILFIIFFVFSCNKKVPEDMNNYVGTWKGKGKCENILLTINKNGIISYTKFNESFSMNTCGSLKYISNDKIEYNKFFKKNTINIQKPPYKSGDHWKMVVGNTELTKISDSEWKIMKKFKL